MFQLISEKAMVTQGIEGSTEDVILTTNACLHKRSGARFINMI